MKKNLSDRKWILFILVLLLLETLWLLVDLQWIKVPFFSKSTVKGAVEAGYVLKAKDDLKRRGSNSLVWENTKEKDILYYKDSVLTLSQSTAKLYLKDQTELELSENTLVTLEEPDDRSKSEIRLRFSKGDLKARNPSAKTHIQGDDWVVNLEKGSEVALRKDKDSYEFEVVTGHASLQTEKGLQSLEDSKILKLGADQQIQQIGKSRDLQWSEKKPLRVYVFDEQAEVALAWAGSAKAISISKVGEDETDKELNANQQSVKVDLKLGNYKVRLKDEKGLSAAKEIEVWKAPKIFLKKPLPRDRLSTGEPHEFVWTSEPGVKEYLLKFGNRTESATENFKSLTFDEDKDIEWKVEGLDDEGHVIPAFYENKVYFRKNPLQAPKLKTPALRELDKNKGGSFHWWQLLLNEARAADDNYEVVFEWEAVEGADNYTIEVSSDPEFKNPELVENLKSTKYVWRKFNRQKKYFWRVASGSLHRMGLFSEAIEVKPEKIKEAASAVEKKPEESPAVVVPPAVEAQLAPAQPLVLPDLPSGWSLAWMPSYKLAQLKGEQNATAKLGGGVPAGLQLEFQKDNYLAHFSGSSQLWKPTPASEYPFQSHLQIPEFWFFLAKESWGFTAHQSFIPRRNSDESISGESQLLLGARYSCVNFGNLGISLLSSGTVHELNFDIQYKKYISAKENKIKYFYGVGGNALYQVQKSGSGFQGNLNFLLGADSF